MTSLCHLFDCNCQGLISKFQFGISKCCQAFSKVFTKLRRTRCKCSCTLCQCNFYKIYSSVKELINNNIFIYLLISLVTIQIILIIILISIYNHEHVSPSEIVIIVIVLVIDSLIILYQCYAIYGFVYVCGIKPILCLFLTTIIAFSNVYLLMFKVDQGTFTFPGDLKLDEHPSYFKITMTFINYSISCQTLTGISSVSPKKILAELFTAIQVLLFGVGYGIFILSVAVLRFAHPTDESIIKSYDSSHYKSFAKMSQTKIRDVKELQIDIPAHARSPLVKRLKTFPGFGVLSDASGNESAKSQSPFSPIQSSSENAHTNPVTRSAAVINPYNMHKFINIKHEEDDVFYNDDNIELIEDGTPYHSLEPFGLSRAISTLKLGPSHFRYPKRNSSATSLRRTKAPASSPIGSKASPPSLSSLSLFPDLQAMENDLQLKQGKSSNKKIHIDRNRVYEGYDWMVYVKWIYNYMTFILFGTQIPRLIAMYVTCRDLDCHRNVFLIIGIILDVLLMTFSFVCVLIRISLISTFGIYVNISPSSLCRAYLTVLTLFGILQFDLWVITKDTTYTAFTVHNTVDINKYWAMFLHFMFYSMSTITNAGVGATIVETGAIGKIIIEFEMIFGLLFTVVIFGVVLLTVDEKRKEDTTRFVKEQQIKISNAENNNNIGYNSILPMNPKGSRRKRLQSEVIRKKSIVLRNQGLLNRSMTPQHIAIMHTCRF